MPGPDFSVYSARAKVLAVGILSPCPEGHEVFLRDPWYAKDIPVLLEEIERLKNTKIQLKKKLDEGPCGKCRKVM